MHATADGCRDVRRQQRGQATDTIRLKGDVSEPRPRLWPGAFVDVTLRLSVDPHAIVVPTAAVQAGQQGQFVYVVKPDRTVEAQPDRRCLDRGRRAVVRTASAPARPS